MYVKYLSICKYIPMYIILRIYTSTYISYCASLAIMYNLVMMYSFIYKFKRSLITAIQRICTYTHTHPLKHTYAHNEITEVNKLFYLLKRQRVLTVFEQSCELFDLALSYDLLRNIISVCMLV